MRRILLFTMFLLLGACSSIPIGKNYSEKNVQVNEDKLKHHLIYINKDGELIDPYSKKVIKNSNEYINELFDTYKNSKKEKITIFIHGGLNTFQNATGKANQILRNYKDENEENYIVLIGWQAGPFTNYLDHLFFVRGGERRRVLGPLTSPFILVEDTARSVAHAPRATAEALLAQSSVPIRIESKEEDAYYTNIANLKNMPENERINIHTTGETRGLNYKNISSLANPLKFVAAPFVDGFGHGTWNSLSRRTELLITKDTAFTRKENAKTALEKFLDKVDQESTKPEITLIGHSMGSMVANNIIIRKPKLNYTNIVYMGAAASLKDVESNVVPILLKNGNAQFFNLSLDPYRELSESKAFGSVPRGSLLIWIDTYLTTVKSFTDRTSGSWFNMVRAADTIFPDTVKKRVHLTKFGFGAGPQKHGEFDEYQFWKHGYWTGDECSLIPLDKPIDVNLKHKCETPKAN
ncbi:alpha/beta hydrolase [Acinetobacter beijerinckii]|uniref:alpha/beta hydrolase n=1 Tax=Acinetobacter beijerinckii TaxID=262668 RepID=UPI0023DD73F4|nr:alpha/beta hydrolase [Acinetobacter beijerinckii]MDF2417999.1 alpha/beta hydrolase [Acinetobacter beijerinckii]